jgi:SpoVK/Ycf46/Vps4 family AAA+-type ATPase
LINIDEQLRPNKWSRKSDSVLDVGFFLAPCILVIGFLQACASGSMLTGISDADYVTFAACNWLPLLVSGALIDMLVFNRSWLRRQSGAQALENDFGTWHFIWELLLLSTLLFSVYAVAVVLAQIWEVRSGFQALVMSAAALGLSVLLLRQVYLIQEREMQGMGQGEANPPVDAMAFEPVRPDAASGQPSVLTQNPPETPGNEADTVFDFDWQWPTAGFDSLAGMQSLKDELQTAIRGFQHYRKRRASAGTGHAVAARFNASAQGGISDRNGILFSGPPGNGKTAFAAAIAAELGLRFVKVGCADITSKWLNQSASMVRDLFRQAALQPTLVFLDEFDGVAMSRANGQMHTEDRKVVNTLLAEIDSARKKPIVLVAATNYFELIDSAICRDGRFDFRIDVGNPDLPARVAILRSLLNQHRLISKQKTVQQVAELWEQRSVAFLEATLKRVRDIVAERRDFEAFLDDFKVAARAASRKASAIPSSGPKLSEIALPANVREYSQSLLYRLKNWQEISAMGGQPPRGVLLYGPPGTGKSLFVIALARELGDWHLFEVHASDVVRDPKVFRAAVQMAQTHRPAIVFIDECDELLASRGSGWNAPACNEILKALDGAGGRVPEVLFLAATNRMEVIDPAALRGGRFDEQVFMDVLRGADLVAFLRQQLQTPIAVGFGPDVDAVTLAQLIGEGAPANIVSLLRRVVNASLGHRAGCRPICLGDFARALQNNSWRDSPSCSEVMN